MKKEPRKKNINLFRKKYFIKNSEITNEQIQKLLTTTKEYLVSINLKYETKIKENILQSTLAMLLINYNLQNKENKG